MKRRAFVSLLAATPLAGCTSIMPLDGPNGEATLEVPPRDWTQFRGGPRRQGYLSQPSQYPVGDDSQLVDLGERSLNAPILDGTTAIVTTERSLIGIDLEAQTPEFRLPIDGFPTQSPARCGSMVAVLTSEAISGYDLESQSRVWSHSARGGFSDSTAPAALRSHFVVQDGKRIRLIEHDSGRVVWRTELDSGVSGFAVDTDRLVVNRHIGDGYGIQALDSATGDERWSIEVESSRLHPILGDSVYVLSRYGRLVSISDGAVQWQVETEALAPKAIAIGDDIAVIVSETSDRFVGVSLNEQRVIWESSLDFGSAVVIVGERAFVSGANTGIVVVDVATGERRQIIENARFAETLTPTPQGLLYTSRPDKRVNLIETN